MNRRAAFSLCALLACHSGAPAEECSCGLGGGIAVDLACGLSDAAPTASGAGCGVQAGSAGFTVTATSPGTCHVEWTSGDGSPMATDIAFQEGWLPCGSDPHGCGQAVVGPASQIEVLCDGGVQSSDDP